MKNVFPVKWVDLLVCATGGTGGAYFHSNVGTFCQTVRRPRRYGCHQDRAQSPPSTFCYLVPSRTRRGSAQSPPKHQSTRYSHRRIHRQKPFPTLFLYNDLERHKLAMASMTGRPAPSVSASGPAFHYAHAHSAPTHSLTRKSSAFYTSAPHTYAIVLV